MSRQFERNILLGLTIALAVGSSTSETDIKVVLEQPLVAPSTNVVVTSLVLTFPPGDEGAPPHQHPGPVVGYVMEGSFLFQVANEAPRVIPTGGTFYEDNGATHVWGANALHNSTCRVLVTLYGRPGEPIMTFVKDFERNSRAEALALAASHV